MNNRRMTEREAIELASGALHWKCMNEVQMINANELTTDINKPYNDCTKNKKTRERMQRKARDD